jgi:NADH-quinone oxidoreductase subunit N
MTVEMESTVLIFIAIFSIIIGCFGALVQDSIKRFFAYTSINQAGFIILGLCCNTLIGTQASLFYLISYMVAMLIFLIVLIESNYKLETIQDILQENTLKKLILIISMFSMAGVPPLLGFVSKYLIWIALVSSISIENLYALNFYDLSLTCAFIISVITSLISSFYYLRFIKIFGFPTYKVIINSTTSEQLLTVANIKCISIGLAFLIIWPVFIQTY